MDNEKNDYGIIGYDPDPITLTSKGLTARLIEACVKTHINTQLFELIDCNKIKEDLEKIIKENLVIKEQLNVEVSLVGESFISIKIILDSLSVDCTIISSGLLENNSFKFC